MHSILLALLATALPAVETAAAEPVAVDQPAGPTIPANTIVEIEIAETISSKTAKVGDMFAIRLVEPVRIDGRLILPIGLTGRGEVSHVAKAGWGGKAGELIVMVRYLECGPQKIRIGRFHFGGSGESHFGAAMGASALVPLAGFLIDGSDMTLAAGTRGNAKLSGAAQLPTGDQPCPLSSSN
jgi:hypothetical protein